MYSEKVGSLSVPFGGRVTLLGASGAGKTVVLRSLLGLDRDAVVRLYDRVIDRKALQAMIGWVPQGDGVFLDQTVFDNVARPPSAKPVAPEIALDALDLLALADRASVPVSSLSLAGRRRVALARALASRRPVLVIDGDLDATLRPLLPMLLEQADHVEAVVTASCTADDWAARADSIALVEGGRIIAQDDLQALRARPDARVKGALAWVS